MTITYVSAYTVQEGDTPEKLVRDYRLSSWQAIVGIRENKPLKSRLEDGLEPGLVIHIPPNANDLLQQRTYSLDRLRPVIQAHFDDLQARCEGRLRPLLHETAIAADSETVNQQITELAAHIDAEIDRIATLSKPLANICEGIARTHIAADIDRAVANALANPRAGLYWSVTPEVLGVWSGMWDLELWKSRLNIAAGGGWQSVQQYMTTVRSLVLQSIDKRLRDTLTQRRQLALETNF